MDPEADDLLASGQGARRTAMMGLGGSVQPDRNDIAPFVVSGDGFGIREIGRYTFDDHNTWAFKTQRIEADGSFYGFGNDLGRGLDVYRFDGAALGRTVPVLEPVDLMPGAKLKKPKRAELLGVLPLDGGAAGDVVGHALARVETQRRELL